MNKKYDGEEIQIVDNKLLCKYCNNKFDKITDLEIHLKKDCKMQVEFSEIYDFTNYTKNSYRSKKSGYIYIIQINYSIDNHYKIGITKNLESRLKSYRTGSAIEPRLHYYFICKDIKSFDPILNNGLVEFHVKREIFTGDLLEIVDNILFLLYYTFKITHTPYQIPIKTGELVKCDCNKYFYSKKHYENHIKIYNKKCTLPPNIIDKKVPNIIKQHINKNEPEPLTLKDIIKNEQERIKTRSLSRADELEKN